MMALSAVMQQIGHTPAFIERHPRHDGRMVVIPFDHFLPFGGDPFDGLIGIGVAVGYFSPDDQPQTIGSIQIAGIYHLLLFSCFIFHFYLGIKNGT